jgi:MFS family permease
MRRYQGLAFLVTANAVSALGTSMTFVAVPWFVLHTTGSAVQTGLVAAAETAGLVLSSALAGPLIDRTGARRASVTADATAAVTVSLIPALYALDVLEVWLIAVLALLLGLSRAPGDASRLALMPAVVDGSGVVMERATSAYEGATRAARMLGGPAAGGLIALWNPPLVLLADAASFVVCALVIGLAPLGIPGSGGSDAAGGPWLRQYLGELGDGLRYLRRDRLVLSFMLMTMFTNAMDIGFATVMLPVHADEVLDGSVQLGFLISAFGVGALCGTILYGWLGARLSRWPTFTVCFLLAGAPRYLALLIEPGFLPVLAALVATGIAFGALNPIMSAVEYARIPENLRGRVLSTAMAGAMLGMPLGTVCTGLLIEGLGLRGALAGLGLLYLAVTLCPLVFPVWRQMNEPAPMASGAR